jgi:hypothetical protein
MHCDGWGHFAEDSSRAAKVFQAEDVGKKIKWLQPGKDTVIF